MLQKNRFFLFVGLLGSYFLPPPFVYKYDTRANADIDVIHVRRYNEAMLFN